LKNSNHNGGLILGDKSKVKNKFNKEKFKDEVKDNIKKLYRTTIDEATPQ